MDRSPGASRVAAQGRIAAGIGGVVLVHAGEEAVKIIKLITRSEVVASSAVGGLPGLMQIAKDLGAPAKYGLPNTELRMIVSDFDSGWEILQQLALLRDSHGRNFKYLPKLFVSPKFAEKVKNHGDVVMADVLVVHTTRKPAKCVMFSMEFRCRKVFYEEVDNLATFLPNSGVQLVVVDMSVLMEMEETGLLSQIHNLNKTLVVTIPDNLEFDEMTRVIDAGPVMIVVNQFHERHSFFVSSLMGE